MQFRILLTILFFCTCTTVPESKDCAYPLCNREGCVNADRGIHCCSDGTRDGAGLLQPVQPVRDTSDLERKLISAGLVDISESDSTIRIDLKYSTAENFMKEDLYGDLERVYLHPEVAEKLVRAQRILKEKHPAYSLLVYDGVRPLSIQQRMWNESDIPIEQRGKFLSNPRNGSLHNYGAAVDLTICDSTGTPLDMGSDYDDPDEISFPSLEQKFLKEGKLTKEQVANRQLLRSVMWQAGFTGIQSEWWHYNALSRAEAKQRYLLVE